MAPEKKVSQGMLNGLTAKQKVTGGALVVVVLIIIWQIMGLFGGGAAPEPAPPPPANGKMTANAPGATSAQGSQGQAIAQTNLRQMPVMTDIQFQQMQQKNEEKYVSKINELEELKVQREIAETNQAIAAAKLATVTAEKSISDLLTRPAEPVVTTGAYANTLVQPMRPGEQAIVQGAAPQGEQASEENAPAPTPPPPVTPPVADYTVISVTMQLHKWTAILGYKGKLYSVSVGDVLPPDGSEVVSISKNVVILKKDDETRKISILTTI